MSHCALQDNHSPATLRSMFSCADISKPTPAPAIPDEQRLRSRKLQVTGRLKVAIEAMAWEGLKLKDAAVAADLTYHALYSALRKPHVLAHYNALLVVLRTAERARNIHRLAEIRDAGNNMPAVQAIGMLERLSDDSSIRSTTSQAATPGVCINIVTHAQSTPERVIEAKPLITLGSDVLPENIRATDE